VVTDPRRCDGVRLRSLTRAITGEARPKQFCPLLDGETLLGAGVLYPLLRIADLAGDVPVAVFPSDHFVDDDRAFAAAAAVALDAVRARPDLVVLLGIEPATAETEYGWIEADERPLPMASLRAPRAVVRAGGGPRVRRYDAWPAAAPSDRADHRGRCRSRRRHSADLRDRHGPWQIAVVVALASSVAVLLDGRPVINVQAAVSAILVAMSAIRCPE